MSGQHAGLLAAVAPSPSAPHLPAAFSPAAHLCPPSLGFLCRCLCLPVILPCERLPPPPTTTVVKMVSFRYQLRNTAHRGFSPSSLSLAHCHQFSHASYSPPPHTPFRTEILTASAVQGYNLTFCGGGLFCSMCYLDAATSLGETGR